MTDLDLYQWKSRLLLVFAPSGDDPAYLEQQRLLEGREADLGQRETLVMHYIDTASIPDVATLRERFQVDQGTFAVVLVGKDGTAKFVDYRPIAIDRLASIIDSMPMRQEEMGQEGRS